MKLARDTWLIFLHQFKLLVRNPIWVVIGIVQPLFYMLHGKAKILAKLHALAPGLAQRALGVVNRMLPGLGGIGPASAKGRDSESAAAPSILTAASDRAAERNNEL